MTFIDLFAGVGGFHRGMELAGHKCMGFCLGVLVERKSLRKWFVKELDIIEKRYKHKYGEDDDNNG